MHVTVSHRLIEGMACLGINPILLYNFRATCSIHIPRFYPYFSAQLERLPWMLPVSHHTRMTPYYII
jgi:hypothetical protein